jgi:tRNA(Leu) C34 or U34 (ribose-2'-O)-methylase TrmL
MTFQDGSNCTISNARFINSRPNPIPQFSATRLSMCNNLDSIIISDVTPNTAKRDWLIENNAYNNTGVSIVERLTFPYGYKNMTMFVEDKYGCKGKKSFDRRSTVGTHNYIPTIHIKTEDEFINFCLNKYSMVCVENNIPEYSHKNISLFDDVVFEGFKNPPIFIFGEEQLGISNSILSACDKIITIPHYGSVRSLNVGSCAATIFAFYRKYFNKKY